MRSDEIIKDPKEKFEELEGEFQILKEIGRGKLRFSIYHLLGSYGVVFKALSSYKDDVDEDGVRRLYAVKRIFQIINVASTLLELRIIKLLEYSFL